MKAEKFSEKPESSFIVLDKENHTMPPTAATTTVTATKAASPRGMRCFVRKAKKGRQIAAITAPVIKGSNILKTYGKIKNNAAAGREKIIKSIQRARIFSKDESFIDDSPAKKLIIPILFTKQKF